MFARCDGGCPLFIVDVNDGVAIRESNRYDQSMFVRDMAYEVDLSSNVQLLEHWSQCIHSYPTLKSGDLGSNGNASDSSGRIKWPRRGPGREAVNQIEHADRKEQDKRTQKQTDVEVQVACDDIKTSHQGDA